MLDVRALTKQYDSVRALDGVSFTVAPGHILGYLGPNGSGKSTTIKIIVGLIEPSSGSVVLNGVDAVTHGPQFRRRLGYVPEEPYLYTHLSATEYLRLVGRLRDIPPRTLDRRIEELLALLDLERAAHSTLAEFSKGMRQRVLLVAALLHDPDLLVLDEPFSGLDVNASLLLRALLQALAARGKMILLSSHEMAIVEGLCRRVTILHRGRIVAEGTPEELRAARLSATLEDVFALVTEQEDYQARANAILSAVARS